MTVPASLSSLFLEESLLEEKELVALARTRDRDAFAVLYSRYRTEIHAYVRGRVRNTALAEDFTSETFLRAWKKVEQYSWEGRPFGAWLTVIARNLVIDHFKSGTARREICTGEIPDLPPGDDALEEAVVSSLSRGDLWNSLGFLSLPQQQCLQLRYRYGLTVAETAAAMGKNSGAVKTLTYRAVRTLEHRLVLDPQAVPL